MTSDGTAKDDVKVPEGDLGKLIESEFEEGKELIITVVSAMGEEMALGSKVRFSTRLRRLCDLTLVCLSHCRKLQRDPLRHDIITSFRRFTWGPTTNCSPPLTCVALFSSSLPSFHAVFLLLLFMRLLSSPKIVQACTKRNKTCRNIGIIAS